MKGEHWPFAAKDDRSALNGRHVKQVRTSDQGAWLLSYGRARSNQIFVVQHAAAFVRRGETAVEGQASAE